MRRFKWTIFCCLAFMVPLMFGCLWSWPTARVSGQSLDVVVSYEEKPVSKVQVRVVSQDEKEVFSFAVTDANGKATLKLPSAGNWLLETHSGFFDADARKLIISNPDATGVVRSIALHWPSSLATQHRFILRTHRIAGQLQQHNGQSKKRLGSARLELHEARTGVLVATTVTDTNGWFDFQNTPEGLYALEILDVPPPPLTDEQTERFTPLGLKGYLARRYSGSFPIEVVGKSTRDDATVIVSFGDCGLTWELSEPI